jgi:hypothetical protein
MHDTSYTPTQPSMPAVPARAEAKNDGLAVCAFLFCVPPIGMILGHASNRAAIAAGRKRSILALIGLWISYIILDVALGVAIGAVYQAPAALLLPFVVTGIVALILNKRAVR